MSWISKLFPRNNWRAIAEVTENQNIRMQIDHAAGLREAVQVGEAWRKAALKTEGIMATMLAHARPGPAPCACRVYKAKQCTCGAWRRVGAPAYEAWADAAIMYDELKAIVEGKNVL